MIDVVLVCVLLIAHCVGDFSCQTKWMALNKSKNWEALSAHVAVYSAVVAAVVAFYWFWPLVQFWSAMVLGRPAAVPAVESVRPLVAFVLVNAAAHFATDAVTSRLTSRWWFLKIELEPGNSLEGDGISVRARIADTGTRGKFFDTIGYDQLVHGLTLVLTAYWLL